MIENMINKVKERYEKIIEVSSADLIFEIKCLEKVKNKILIGMLVVLLIKCRYDSFSIFNILMFAGVLGMLVELMWCSIPVILIGIFDAFHSVGVVAALGFLAIECLGSLYVVWLLYKIKLAKECLEMSKIKEMTKSRIKSGEDMPNDLNAF